MYKDKALDAHDRLLHVKNQNFDIAACCQDIIDQKPFGNRPFYIFAHQRTIDDYERIQFLLSGEFSIDNLPSKKIVWQPRLTKPEAQENSMLFKAYPPGDNIKIVWIIPEKELWCNYEKGKVMENSIVYESIQMFKNNKKKLEEKEPDDLSEQEIHKIYLDIKKNSKKKSKVIS